MGQLTELEPLRKKRKFKKLMRRIIILSIVLVTLVVGTILWKQLEEIDIRTKFTDFISSIGTGQGYPLNTQGSTINNLIKVGNQVGAIDDTNFYIYNQTGKQTSNIQHGYNNPVVKAEGGKILLYDRGGNKLRVDSKSRNLISKTYDHNIIYADIASNGHIAVATGSNEYAGQVIVYNDKFEEILKWFSSDGLMLNIALSPNKDMMAVASIDAVEGVLISTVSIIKFNTKEVVAKLQMPEETIFSLEFKENGKIYAVTDKGVYKISSNGNIDTKLDFEGTSLYAFDNNNNRDMAVILGNYKEDRSLILYSLNDSLDVTSQIEFYQEIKEVEIDNFGIVVTLDDRIELYDFTLKLTDTIEAADVKNTIPIERNLYYNISNQIDKENVTRPPRNKSSSSTSIDSSSEKNSDNSSSDTQSDANSSEAGVDNSSSTGSDSSENSTESSSQAAKGETK